MMVEAILLHILTLWWHKIMDAKNVEKYFINSVKFVRNLEEATLSQFDTLNTQLKGC